MQKKYTPKSRLNAAPVVYETANQIVSNYNFFKYSYLFEEAATFCRF